MLYLVRSQIHVILNGLIVFEIEAGPANTYSHYVTTREEYGVQRYEGASTIYGPCESCAE